MEATISGLGFRVWGLVRAWSCVGIAHVHPSWYYMPESAIYYSVRT